MWNVFYDSLLRIKLPVEALLVGFADDIALVVVNYTIEGIEQNTNDALVVINKWMQTNGLELTHSKSEAVKLTRRWAFRSPLWELRG